MTDLNQPDRRPLSTSGHLDLPPGERPLRRRGPWAAIRRRLSRVYWSPLSVEECRAVLGSVDVGRPNPAPRWTRLRRELGWRTARTAVAGDTFAIFLGSQADPRPVPVSATLGRGRLVAADTGTRVELVFGLTDTSAGLLVLGAVGALFGVVARVAAVAFDGPLYLLPLLWTAVLGSAAWEWRSAPYERFLVDRLFARGGASAQNTNVYPS